MVFPSHYTLNVEGRGIWVATLSNFLHGLPSINLNKCMSAKKINKNSLLQQLYHWMNTACILICLYSLIFSKSCHPISAVISLMLCCKPPAMLFLAWIDHYLANGLFFGTILVKYISAHVPGATVFCWLCYCVLMYTGFLHTYKHSCSDELKCGIEIRFLRSIFPEATQSHWGHS